MNHPKPNVLTRLSCVLSVCCAALFALPAVAQEEARIIRPGAPGEPSREITAAEASDLAGIKYTSADVEFMQGMIAHHAQALEMTELLESRSRSEEMRILSKRIELSQADEIQMMQEWLAANGEVVPEIVPTLAAAGEPSDAPSHGEHEGHGMHGGHQMPGMLTADQMTELAASEGALFDRLFLERMIDHHRGALVMVDDLMSSPGAAQESTIFGFTTDVVADQTAEIDRMGAMLAGLSTDPRVGLRAGFRDAGESLWNMQLVAAVPKPTGFFDPALPEGTPIPVVPTSDAEADGEEDAEDEDSDGANTDPDGEETAEDAEAAEAAAKEAEQAANAARRAAMSSILNFANSDMAFSGTTLFNGNFHGFNTYNLEDPKNPRLLASIVCPGGQGDVSVVGDLLIMSVEQTRGRLDCGAQGVSDPVSKERFRGVRIFDISDLRLPQQVAAVQTCRGSHTHTVVTDVDDAGNLYVYGSGTSSVRDSEELEGCSDLPPGEDENSALFSIDVIQIPVAAPERSRVVNRPRIFADPETGRIAGLWKGGKHGTGTQRSSETNQCHDITVFPEGKLAAGACSGNGILLDISDPVNPVRLDQVIDESFAYWHSATFNNDGTKVVFTDEWGGGMRPRCRASDPREWGANAIFDIIDGKLEFRSYYKLPAPQSDTENCVAHNGSLVPVPGRDIMVQAWYQGGVSVFDFTDSNKPFEIAHFDRGPINGDDLLMGGHWSAYWYDGHIYGTEIARGLDILKLTPSEFLSQNEIDAADSIGGGEFNPQQQQRVEWRPTAVALASLDQLERGESISAAKAKEVGGLLSRVARAMERGRSNSGLSSRLRSAADALRLDDGASAIAMRQRDALRGAMEALASELE